MAIQHVYKCEVATIFHGMTDHNPRDLEWVRRYEENDTPWDKGAAAPPLVSYLKTNAILGRVLVPGCGRGHDVRALAAQPKCEAMGLDLAPMAVEDARQLATKAGLERSATFVLGDYFRMPTTMIGAFDWIMEHTCFCALESKLRTEYVRASAGALKSGGKFFGIFYLTPDVEAGPPFAVSKEELSRLFDPHFTLLEEWVPKESFPGREGRELVRILQKR